MLEKLDIQRQVTKTKQIAICLMVLLIARVFSLTMVMRGLGIAEKDLAAAGISYYVSYYSRMLGFAFFGCFGILLIIAAMVGIHRKMLWGAICAAIVAVLNLTTLFFPISFLIIWYLLPDSVREEIAQEIKPIFSKQI
jgi:hypothetical protein